MKNKIKKFLVSFTCVLLACVMLFMTACSSVPQNEGNNPPSSSDSSVSGGGGNNEDSGSNNGDNNTPVKPSNPDDTDFEDYELNEAENFVYSLIYSDLTKQYDTFIGYVPLQTSARSTESVEVYGISYVDYEEGYIDESGKTYFSAGFISFPGEPVINQANIDAGLEIVSLEEEYDELFSYVYTYTTEDVHMHCVIDNKYVKYDVVDGVIQYEEEPYVEGMDVDFTRGNVYCYDIEDYVYIVEEQDYVPVSGVSLLGEADYQDIMNKVNEILKTQEAYLTYAEIESYVSQSQDALCIFLLGLQQETFIGIPTAELVDIVRDLDPMQHLQIGVDANGTTTIEIIEVTKLPSLWEKIATSLVCAFGIVGGFVCSAVGCPVIGGALIGASMEAFSQVVISNTPVSDIQWAQVAVAAVSGAIAGGVSGAINGIATKGVGQLIMKEVADTLCDSVIGGGEFFVNSLIAGCSFEEACKNFGYGVIAGAVISGGIKIGSAAIKGGAKLIKKATTSTVSDVGGKQLTKLGNEAAEDSISELQEKTMQKSAKKGAKEALDEIAVDREIAEKYSAPYSKYNSRWAHTPKDGGGGHWNGIRGESDFVLDTPIQLPDGTKITKVTYKNAIPDFSPYQEAKVKISNMSDKRYGSNSNFGKADEALAKEWDQIKHNGKSWTARDVANYREANHLTWHEMNNMEYMQLVPFDVNAKFGHLGGVGEYNAMIDQLGGNDFD